MMGRHFLVAAALLLTSVSAMGQGTANLLRNADFQDDWLTLIPKNKNHHWVYFSDFYNRRDFNPDCWTLVGSWDWRDSDKPRGQRRMVLRGPSATLTQQINWAAIHDDRIAGGGSPDMGGFPGLAPQRSLRPERLVGDLTLRVRVKGTNIPASAASIQLQVAPATVQAALPSGSYDWKWVELQLPHADWLAARKQATDKDAKEKAESAKAGVLLPPFVNVQLAFKGTGGELAVERVELLESKRDPGPNLLTNGSFEAVDGKGYPAGWSQPRKYRYFPPGYYYIFNTWHNSRFPNRGPVAADNLLTHDGGRSLKMIVASGDEKCVISEPILLQQKEARLIEVHAWVKHDRLAMLQIDAEDDKGRRLDCFNFIQKMPFSIGTEDWHEVRQVFRPREPVASIRLKLCARGGNGYTLDGVGQQPQNNFVGTIWWDDVRVTEPESTPQELAQRGIKPASQPAPFKPAARLEALALGERKLGTSNLSAVIVNEGKPAAYSLLWEFTAPSGKKAQLRSPAVTIAAGGRAQTSILYTVEEIAPAPYTEHRGTLTLLADGKKVQETELWFGTWTTPIKIDLGALYLRPEQQKQLVRLNLGLSANVLESLAEVKVLLNDRRTGKAIRTVAIPRPAAAIRAQRDKIPRGLRGDLASLLLVDVDVSDLPVEPFNNPQRHYFVRVEALGPGGKPAASVDSAPFCRQAAEPAQPGITSVKIKKNLLYLDDKPWMPWGVCYGHVPVYAGPADPGAGGYLDLHNLPAWSIYDGFTAAGYTRKQNDFNCLRYVAGSITDAKIIQKHWTADNLYCSSAFAVPDAVYSLEALAARAGGKDKLDAYLAFVRTAPMVVSVAPGIEEAFGTFHAASSEQLKGMADVVTYVRNATAKPVMVGHGGYFNRFEFEKAPFFDIYDPETEPLYPANIHTDLWPLVQGKDKVIWLRPQMYEDVPYERWRFHVFVELMRGCRGWQIAHGPGDQSLFRGLHGELEFMKPIAYSQDACPQIQIKPALEHWSRRHNGKVYLIAATTRGLQFGRWSWSDDVKAPNGRCRVTDQPDELRSEANAFSLDKQAEQGPSIHGIQHLPDARSWPADSKIVQWVRLDPKARPANLVILAKTSGRWQHAASWGKVDMARWRKDPKQAYWFLHSVYRHAYGFLGWDRKLVDKALDYVPAGSVDMGALPEGAGWVKLEVPLARIGATGSMLDGVAFMHEKGRIWWGPTSIVTKNGSETFLWGESLGPPTNQLEKTRILVTGLKANTKVRVLFEDRDLTAGDGYFVDDFRGKDLYQRFGSMGYGSEPVAFHVYEIEVP